MRLAHSVLVPALCWASSATASHVYIREAHGSRREVNDDRRTLSPMAARMVLAQRAGVEQYHSADIQHPDALQAVNDFGSRRDLFGDEVEERRQAFILLETDDDLSSTFRIASNLAPSYTVHANINPSAATLPSSEKLSHFHISPAPSSSSTESLFSDILHQLGLDAHPAGFELPTVASSNKKISVAQSLTYKDFKPSDYDSYDLLILTVPSTPSSSSTSENLWGTYSMPHNSHSYLHKHKRDTTEKPLELADIKASPTAVRVAAASPLKGIFPTCFPSLSTCQSLTRNCSSHGSCSLKYTDPSANDKSPSKHCYSCACKPQKRETSDGKEQTTYWGGPACQKKDISVEFWLIVLFSVAMVGLVGFAVGTVWDMGEEELPSVIGAGVSGPVARR